MLDIFSTGVVSHTVRSGEVLYLQTVIVTKYSKIVKLRKKIVTTQCSLTISALKKFYVYASC